MALDAGTLNRRVTIERRVAGQDAIGQPSTTWETVAQTWANIRHPSGLSAIKGDADTSIVKTSIRIRYRTGLDAGMRVMYGSDAYHIEAVLPDISGREFMDLVCERAT